MNLAQLKKAHGQRVQLIPVACRLDDLGRQLPEVNDAWLIDQVTDEGVHVSNPRTGHITVLGRDHIHHFTSNPDASRFAGVPHGFFTLLVQVYLQGPRLWIVPTPRPGKAVPPPAPRVSEKLVDLRFPSDSGLQAHLEAQGYQVVWSLETRVSRRVELEGWEVVTEPDGSGGFNTYRVRDRPADQILIKRRAQSAA
jgi:hypothetical protein